MCSVVVFMTVRPMLLCSVQRQSSLMRQTPYERKLTGFSPGDTKILLGQSDFHETLKRPGKRTCVGGFLGKVFNRRITEFRRGVKGEIFAVA